MSFSCTNNHVKQTRHAKDVMSHTCSTPTWGHWGGQHSGHVGLWWVWDSEWSKHAWKRETYIRRAGIQKELGSRCEKRCQTTYMHAGSWHVREGKMSAERSRGEREIAGCLYPNETCHSSKVLSRSCRSAALTITWKVLQICGVNRILFWVLLSWSTREKFEKKRVSGNGRRRFQTSIFMLDSWLAT